MKKSILIVDDERRMADSLRDLLEAEGYEARAAYSGREAIEALAERPAPVVITDLRMTDVGGLDLIRHLAEEHPKTLVIVITGYASTESAIEALHYHAFDYIRKPFEFEQIKAVIEGAFRKLEVDQLRRDMAAMITHDIKVPLTSILGYASLLAKRFKGELPAKAADYSQHIYTSTRKVLDLIENYLTTSQAEVDELALNPRPVRLSELLHDLEDVMSTEAARKGFTLEMDAEGAPDAVVLDESLTYRALANLLQNAVKYGDRREPIRLEARAVEAEASPLGRRALRITVTNSAPHLDLEDLSELFQRYERASPTGRIEGSGLGLYVVDAVAKAHGGIAEAGRPSEDFVSFGIVIPLDLVPVGM